jgi:hypothetical protein
MTVTLWPSSLKKWVGQLGPHGEGAPHWGGGGVGVMGYSGPGVFRAPEAVVFLGYTAVKEKASSDINRNFLNWGTRSVGSSQVQRRTRLALSPHFSLCTRCNL